MEEATLVRTSPEEHPEAVATLRFRLFRLDRLFWQCLRPPSWIVGTGIDDWTPYKSSLIR